MCCFSRKVLPGYLQDIPIELHHLYFGMDDLAKEFQKNIRTYNNTLAFTSVGQDAYSRLQIDNSINDGHGPWLSGQLGWNPKMELTLHNQTEAPDEDNNAQLFEPGEEPQG
jgi:hypothetical protein